MSSLIGGGKIRFAASLHAYIAGLFRKPLAPDRVSGALGKYPDIAAVEDVEVACNASGPSISAFVVVAGNPRDSETVVRCAAESLRRQLQANEVILSYIDGSGQRRGILIVGSA